MKRIIFLLCFLPILLCAETYNLENLIDIGLKNNLSLQQAELNKDLANSQLNKSYWDLSPDITANLSRTDYFYKKNTAQTTSANQTNTWGISVVKTLQLNDPNYFSYKFAKFDKNTAELKYENEKRSFILDIVSAYISVLDSQKQLEVQKKNQIIQENILKQSKILFNQKKKTDFDVTQSEITLLNVKIAITKIENDIINKRNTLFNLINQKDENYMLTELDFTEDFQINELNMDANQDIQVLQREVNRSDISLKQTYLNYFPDLSLRYDFSQAYQSPDFAFDNDSKTHTLSLNASYNFLSFFKNKESYTQSRINKKTKELNLQSMKQNIESQYQQYKDEYTYLKQLDNLYNLKKDNTSLNLNIAEQRYQLGMIEQLELDKARYENFDALQAYESNRYKLIELTEKINFLLSKKILNKY